MDENKVNLCDPTADYCKELARIIMKFIKSSNKCWYKLFRSFGCTASDSIKMARYVTQTDIDKYDFTINFDRPMQ